MGLINLKNLSVTLGTTLFSNLNLTLGAGDRLGLVAANGRGKSTLLRCMAGAVEPTTGDVTRSRGLRVGHVEQDIPAGLRDVTFYELLQQALPAEQIASETWRVDVALDSLEVPQALHDRSFSRLSGGWQRLAMLARTWITEPDLLLLDEPTNHLDLVRITQLEEWLNALPKDVPLVIASHDRAFLDATTNRTLFLRAEQSHVFPLSYTRARHALDEADASDERRYQKDMKVAQQLRRQAAKLNNIGVNSGSDLLVIKTKQLKQRASRLEEFARPGYQERSSGVIKLANSGTHAKVLLTFDDTPVATPDGTPLFRTGKRWINQGDRIVLLGSNGVGKSRFVTLIKAAVDHADLPAGTIAVTPSLTLGYSDQTLSEVPDSDTPMAAVCRRFDVGDQRARSLLAGAGVAIDIQNSRIGVLSGGQKARLMMLLLRLANPNFYLLDEPTNHLDIDGQEALESELMKHDATCLLVSHDRSFIRAVGNRFWLIENRRLIEVDDPEGFFRTVAERRA